MSAGRGLTVGAQIMDSESHFDVQEDVFQMFVETGGPWANVIIHVGKGVLVLSMLCHKRFSFFQICLLCTLCLVFMS